jgi:hypothetical protein
MADYRFIHVGFKWSGPPKTKELESIFGKALDWLRYTPNCWILYTKIDPGAWYQRIKPHLDDGDYVLIAELNLTDVGDNYSGYQPKWIWEWIKKHRE